MFLLILLRPYIASTIFFVPEEHNPGHCPQTPNAFPGPLNDRYYWQALKDVPFPFAEDACADRGMRVVGVLDQTSWESLGKTSEDIGCNVCLSFKTEIITL